MREQANREINKEIRGTEKSPYDRICNGIKVHETFDPNGLSFAECLKTVFEIKEQTAQ